MVWPRADLRSAGPPTSKMYLGAGEYRGLHLLWTFQRHRVRPLPYIGSPLYGPVFLSPPCSAGLGGEKNFHVWQMENDDDSRRELAWK